MLPTVPTPRLVLRNLDIEDAYPLQSWASNPEVSQYTLWNPHRHLSDSYQYIEAVQRRIADGTDVEWGIEQDHKLVGTIGLYLLRNCNEKGTGTAELGYALAKDAWGQGIATEAAQHLLQAVQAAMGIGTVYAKTVSANTASVRVLEKSGFSLYRIEKTPLAIKGQEYEVSTFKRGRVSIGSRRELLPRRH